LIGDRLAVQFAFRRRRIRRDAGDKTAFLCGVEFAFAASFRVSVPRQDHEKTNQLAERHDEIEAYPAHQVAALDRPHALGSIHHAVVLLESVLGANAGSIRLN